MRLRTPDDLPNCIALLESVQRLDGYPSTWPSDPGAWLTPDGFLDAWVALCETRLLGHVALGTVDETADPQFTGSAGRAAPELAEVKRLFVHPQTRRAGVARQLLEAAVHGARARTLWPVLEVTADRRGAVQCYERNGWRRIGSSIANWQRADGERPLLYQYEWPT